MYDEGPMQVRFFFFFFFFLFSWAALFIWRAVLIPCDEVVLRDGVISYFCFIFIFILIMTLLWHMSSVHRYLQRQSGG